MSCVFAKDKLGVAVYDAARSTLSVAEASEHERDLPVAPVLQLFKYQFQPTKIIAPARGDERFTQALEAPFDEDGGDAVDVEIMPSSDYAPMRAQSTVANIMLPDMSSSLSPAERAQYISSIVSFDDTAMIRAAGGLLVYLTKSGALNSLVDDGSPYPIRCLKNVTLDGIMTVDQHAHKALSVFESDRHPSFQGIGVKKEGFSLFGILAEYCASTTGRELLRQWLVRPINSPELIEDRLDTIEYLLDMRNKELRDHLHTSIKQMRDTERIVTRIQRLSASANDWANLVRSCKAAQQIWHQLERMSRNADAPPLLKNVTEAWNPNTLASICKLIEDTLDLKESRDKGRFIIKGAQPHECCRSHGETMQFECREGMEPGDTFPHTTQYGEQVTIEVPDGVSAGESFNHFVPYEAFIRKEQQSQQETQQLVQLENLIVPSYEFMEESDEYGNLQRYTQLPATMVVDTDDYGQVQVNVPEDLEPGSVFRAEFMWSQNESAAGTGRVWTNQCSYCDLDELKHHYQGMDDLLNTLAKEEATQLFASRQDFADLDLKLVFYQQFGYLLSLASDNPQVEQILSFRGDADESPPDGASNVAGGGGYIYPDQMLALGYDFQFESKEGSTHGEMRYFFRNGGTRRMDEHFGNIFGAILDMEKELYDEMLESVLAEQDLLFSISGLAAQLDCLIALSLAAESLRLCRPIISEDGETIIENGRHILQEMCVDTFIPNTTECHPQAGLIKMLTGPNYSGKSVYIKQVGLITLMVHIGSFVPADNATVALTDRIFTAITNIDSVNIIQSTFAQDLAHVATMLQHATAKSLLLIDEFGTAPQDGIALLVGAVTDLLSRGQQCPKAFVTTHFIQALELLPKSQLLHFQAMEFSEQLNQNTTPTPSATAGIAAQAAAAAQARRVRGERTPKAGPYMYAAQTPVRGSTTSSGAANANPRLAAAAAQQYRSRPDIVFLYRLVDGKSQDSFGRICAAMAGVDDEILDRSAEISAALEAGDLPEPTDGSPTVDSIGNINAGNGLGSSSTPKVTEAQRTLVESFLELDTDNDDVCAFVANLPF